MFPNERFPQERVVIVCGDISKEHLGLSVDDYSMCVEHTAAVYHCAADVRHFGQWETSYAVNTLGTQHVIELCFAAGAALHHVSTISVNGYVLTSIGDKLVDEFTEDNLYIGQRYRENIYVHSKYLAEKRVLDARREGLNANIYRIGNLLWRTTDGKFQTNRDVHDFYMLTHAFLELGADVREVADLEVDLTAVDSCARAIRVLSEDQLGQVYHIMSPYPVALHEYLQTVSQKKISTLPMDEFKLLLQKHESDPKFGFMLAYMAANETMDASAFPVERNKKTITKLKQLGFVWEEPTAEYARYVF
jgi:thioester reductase-like protein